jgi:hypothetical protein
MLWLNTTRSPNSIMAHSWQGTVVGHTAPPMAQRRKTGQLEGDTREILSATVRLFLQTVQRMRAAEACIFDVLTGPSSDPVPCAMMNALKQFPDLVKKAGKGHGLGEPPAHSWAALILSLSLHENVSVPIREEMKAYHASLSSPVALSKQVKFCKCTLLYDKSQCKIQFSVQGDALTKRTSIITALSAIKFVTKDGTAPRNHLERQLQTFLDSEGA